MLSLADTIAVWALYSFLTNLIVGTVVSFFFPKRRLLVGGLFLAIGALESLFFLSLLNASLQMSHYVPVGLAASLTIVVLTVIMGIVSLCKSKREG